MRQWSHYTIETKRSAVLAILSGQTARAVEKATGIDHHLLAAWVRAYQQDGDQALVAYRRTRRYPAALKAQVVAEYQTGGTSLRKLCVKYDISNPGLCAKWVNQATAS
ncbi:transposase [Lacticaseibacillus sp. N501-2]|uniref:transposase n=1 Tax=Lacticaseibacillus salsurae TaxID=3367729 RepID=UPI0038B331B3